VPGPATDPSPGATTGRCSGRAWRPEEQQALRRSHHRAQRPVPASELLPEQRRRNVDAARLQPPARMPSPLRLLPRASRERGPQAPGPGSCDYTTTFDASGSVAGVASVTLLSPPQRRARDSVPDATVRVGSAASGACIPARPHETQHTTASAGCQPARCLPRRGPASRRRPTPRASRGGRRPVPKATVRLQFRKRKDRRLPGRVYLCIDGQDKSFVAGSFEAVADAHEPAK
jgi:hypothetical protein